MRVLKTYAEWRNSKPVWIEDLSGENMNEILIYAKENYKLSHYLMCTKSRKKAAGPSSRVGFKQRPDCEAENSFSSGKQESLNYQGWKKTYTLRLPQSQKNPDDIKPRWY